MERRNLIRVILYAALGIALVAGVIYLLRNREEILTNRLKINAPAASIKSDTKLPDGTRPLDSYERAEPFKPGDKVPFIPTSKFQQPAQTTSSQPQ